MSFSVTEENTPSPVRVEVTDSEVVVALADERTISTPLVWYPTLQEATAEQRRNFVLGPSGIHWPDIDEDLSVAGMLAGVKPTPRGLGQHDTPRKGNASAPGENSDTEQRLQLEFIDPLFAIAIDIGVAEGIMRSKWFVETRSPSGANEWFDVLVFGLGFVTAVLSWFGYHQSLRTRPLRGQTRFAIDVLLVLLYAVILVKYDNFSAVLFLLMIVFVLYPVWDLLKIFEHRARSRATGYRREIVSAFFGFYFFALWLIDFYSLLSRAPLCFLALGGVVAYRELKAHRFDRVLGISVPPLTTG